MAEDCGTHQSIWLSVVQAAERASVSTRTVKRWIKAAAQPLTRLPSPKGRGHLRVRLGDLEAVLARDRSMTMHVPGAVPLPLLPPDQPICQPIRKTSVIMTSVMARLSPLSHNRVFSFRSILDRTSPPELFFIDRKSTAARSTQQARPTTPDFHNAGTRHGLSCFALISLRSWEHVGKPSWMDCTSTFPKKAARSGPGA